MHDKNPQKALRTRLLRRRARVRARVSGSAARPRLVATRSLKHMRAQIIDDSQNKTLVAVSDLDLKEKAPEAAESRTAKVARAYAIGRLLAERAKEQGINQVVFDRAGRKYHGRIQALADGARDGGLVF